MSQILPDLSAVAAASARTRAPGRWRAVSAVAVSLVVFGAVVAVVSLDLRGMWRAQVLRREGEVLHAVAQMQRAVVAQNTAGTGLTSADEALAVALDTSKLRGVLAVRLFDGGGEFLDAVPAEIDESRLAHGDVVALAGDAPLVRFHPHYALGNLFLQRADSGAAPLLEVNAALAPGVLAQYWLDGSGIAREFAALDRRIALQAGAAFLAGALLIAGSLVWAFRRLERANRQLRAHADDLVRANRELAQAARTSAIGALTAHLMHGLRNPLAGLEDFVAAQSGGTDGDPQGEWASARESTRRLRAMINEVQSVMSDVHTGAEFEVTAGELCADLGKRLQPVAARHGVQVEFSVADDPRLAARTAGIGGLVLANLAQNAIEASPRGVRVRVHVSIAHAAGAGVVACRVSDEGAGLPPDVAADPFRPRRSTKPDGAGIGLAISRELARHAGGELTLESTGRDGTVFSLKLPGAPARNSRR